MTNNRRRGHRAQADFEDSPIGDLQRDLASEGLDLGDFYSIEDLIKFFEVARCLSRGDRGCS